MNRGKSKVYFLKDFKKIQKVSLKLLDGFYPENSDLLVKIHFGEPGNKTALFPKDIKPIIEVLKSFGIKPTLIDTPVAYPSERGTVKGYEKVVKKRGWDKLAPFIISNNYKKIKTRDFTAEVCEELINAKNVLVISHVKGHACSGFGGAIKNFGMGGVSKKTKVIEHSLCKPRFVVECRGCGTCVRLCPARVIKMVNSKAKINLNECWGCSICQLECPYSCLAPQKAIFDDLLAQGAAAVINQLPKRTFYINIIKNITKSCDCEVDSGKIISKNIGILFSENPVAIDKASVDLINQAEGRDVFKDINHKDPMLQIDSAERYTGKGKNYDLVKV